MKRVAKPLILSIFVTSAALADNPQTYPYTDQTLTTTAGGSSVGADGHYGGEGDGSGGIDGDVITITFTQNSGGPGNSITTTNEPGVNATSNGGEGGEGGDGGSGSHGGSGGNGGEGGAISVSNVGKLEIATNGNNADGIHTQAQGGTGGDGGDSGVSGPGSVGGYGGAARTVSISLVSGASITTTGSNSNAILAESLAGNTGNNGETSANFGGGQQNAGVRGGDSGLVTVTLDSGVTLAASGNDSHGIVAKSISGNGGDGGYGSGGSIKGGNGGDGGNSGGVTITSGATITTRGTSAIGIVGQASSGSGGAGGETGAFLSSEAGGPGKGGTVDDINITNSGTITTSGTYSLGMLAQSISGGGGVGGSASGSLFHDVGGSAADNNNAGAINLTHSGGVTTTGDNSQGIVAQSIGGGGGLGGDAGGMLVVDAGAGGIGGQGGAVNLALGGGMDASSQSSWITTSGQASHGAVAQSIGGGGGLGGAATSAGAIAASAVGGAGGLGGNGGSAQINATEGSITTSGSAAIGLIAQSIGGGGGAGGGAYTTSAGPIVDVAVAVGGNGGNGGSAGNASAVLSSFYITTSGLQEVAAPAVDALGILVQSIGGGGGNGGSGAAAAYAIAMPNPSEEPGAKITFSTAVAIGGSGAQGGDGGSATAQMGDGGAITTSGVGSHGLVLQSIGGGGGNGGDSSALAATIGYGVKNSVNSDIAPKTNAINISTAVGGNGGGGGSGGTAQMTFLGSDTANSNAQFNSIVTNGAEAAGAVIQSIGGGGGNAGVGNAKVQSTATSQNLDLTVSVGGRAGVGGSGGAANATVYRHGAISTYGASAEGLVVQSIGGGGGIGSGSSVDLTGLDNWVNAVTAIPADKEVDPSGNKLSVGMQHNTTVKVGATGGAGGNGGTVTVANQGSINTYGVDSPGIVAQSIGGGGGLGGSAGATSPTGTSAQQAVGMSDDPSGPNVSVPITVKTTLDVGGSMGGYGNGGAVTVTHAGDIASNGDHLGSIATVGDHSPGILAQSIGAGGGRGGVAVAGAEVNGSLANALKTIGSVFDLSSTITVGYTASANFYEPGEVLILGDGGNTTVNLNSASISTGAPAAADAGSSGSNYGFQSFGILAQSIGGGGGTATDGTSDPNTTVNLGAVGGDVQGIYVPYGIGSFGSGGEAVITDANSTGSGPSLVTTYGDAAHGLFVQSIGGGGGVFGAGSSQTVPGSGAGRSVAIGLGAGDIVPAEDPLGNGGQFGGNGSGDGGHAGVDLDKTAVNITTFGHGAFGIMAQSIGGGGGTVAVAPGTNSIVSYIGSQRYTGGDGGSVTVQIMNTGSSITTSGVGAHGIMAQSVSGGGGLVDNYRSGMTPTLTRETPPNMAPTAALGNGGEISVNSYATITTTGAGAFGILAQSVGGGGGWVVNDDGTVFAGTIGGPEAFGGSIGITVHNTVRASGLHSNGVWAQSVGAGGGETVTINLEDAAQIYGGTGEGVGIKVDSGSIGNQININAGTSVGALSGRAIQADNGLVNVSNNGTIYGDTALGSGTFSGNNPIPGSPAGAMAGTLTNGGTLVPTPGQRSLIDGYLVQTASGRIAPHLDYSNGRSGRYEVTRDAVLAGTIEPTLVSALPSIFLPVLTVDGSQTGSLTAPDSPLFSYTLRQNGGQHDIAITGTHFNDSRFGLSQHKNGVANALQSVFAAGNPKNGPFFAALDATAGADVASYRDAIGELSPRSTMTLLARTAADASRIADASMSCPEFSNDAGLWKAFLTEGECAYFMTRGQHASLSGDTDRGESQINSLAWQVGGQREIRPGLLLGGSLAYQSDWFSASDGVSADGSSVQGAVTLKYQTGPVLLTGALFGGVGSYDITRRISAPGFSESADAHAPYYTAGARARAAYTVGSENLYLRPYVNLDLVHAHSNSFTEGGAGGFGLKIQSSSYSSAILTPAVEFGGRRELSNGKVLRSFVSVGTSMRSNANWKGQATFEGGQGYPSFDMNAPIDRVTARIGAGLQLYLNERTDLRIQYDGEFGSQAKTHSGTASFAYRF